MNGKPSPDKHKKREEMIAYGIPIGAGAGVALGLILQAVFDNPGFFGLGIAIGVSLGITISISLAERE